MIAITAFDVLVNVGYSLAGAIVYAVGSAALRRRAERRGAYAGLWKGEIRGPDGTVVKVDQYAFRNVADVIEGDIERQSPGDQRHRRWKMYGRVRGRDFFAVFWSTDPAVLSYGCWYLHQVGDFKFDGYYLRLDEGANGVAVNPIPLCLTRIRGAA